MYIYINCKLSNKILGYEKKVYWSYMMTLQCQAFMLFVVEPNKDREDNKYKTHNTHGTIYTINTRKNI